MLLLRSRSPTSGRHLTSRPREEGRGVRCQYYVQDLVRATLPDARSALPLRRCWYMLRRYVWYASATGPVGLVKRVIRSTMLGKSTYGRGKCRSAVSTNDNTMNLRPGEWVEVCSLKEIFATLDAEGKNMGLSFIREMERLCGRRFKVYKRLTKIILEATGEMRTIRAPTVLLEGAICDGEFHGGCTRSCFFFWREVWLKRVRAGE